MRTGDSVAVGVVAVDGMTERNEADGLPAGDELLRTAAECFGGGVRPYDTVCRLGGNDFALVLPAMEAEPARALIERLAAAFAASAGGATVSAGVAAFPANGDTQAELMRLATGALYWARRGGGGRVVAYDADVVEALSGEEHARRLERDTYERTLRALDAAPRPLGHSASGERLRGPPRRGARVPARARGPAADGGLPLRRDRAGRRAARAGAVAARVASSALDAEAAGWLEAPAAGGADGPLESRIIALAAAFVEAGGHTGNAGAGRALADLWQRREEFDPACMRALESLLAAREAV